jgi:hypothetical protein
MRFLYDAFVLLIIAAAVFCAGIGLAMAGDASLDLLLNQGRFERPGETAVMGLVFVAVGVFGVWWARFSYNFITMTRVR